MLQQETSAWPVAGSGGGGGGGGGDAAAAAAARDEDAKPVTTRTTSCIGWSHEQGWGSVRAWKNQTPHDERVMKNEKLFPSIPSQARGKTRPVMLQSQANKLATPRAPVNSYAIIGREGWVVQAAESEGVGLSEKCCNYTTVTVMTWGDSALTL